jgi:hypothetical protein
MVLHSIDGEDEPFKYATVISVIDLKAGDYVSVSQRIVEGVSIGAKLIDIAL